MITYMFLSQDMSYGKKQLKNGTNYIGYNENEGLFPCFICATVNKLADLYNLYFPLIGKDVPEMTIAEVEIECENPDINGFYHSNEVYIKKSFSFWSETTFDYLKGKGLDIHSCDDIFLIHSMLLRKGSITEYLSRDGFNINSNNYLLFIKGSMYSNNYPLFLQLMECVDDSIILSDNFSDTPERKQILAKNLIHYNISLTDINKTIEDIIESAFVCTDIKFIKYFWNELCLGLEKDSKNYGYLVLFKADDEFEFIEKKICKETIFELVEKIFRYSAKILYSQ